LGGILQQCVHPGFGLSLFNEELTGPEYAGRFIEKVEQAGIQTLLDTMVLEVRKDGTIYCTNSRYGITMVKSGSVVLAMGCREKTRGNIQIPGTRPAGIYTAGSAQRMVNRQNEMVGKKVVILGSGDIGMIMARRLTLEGAKVVAVVEVMDYLAGLTRNRVQCLDDFGIPLLLSHTVTRIVGNQRVEGVYVAKVDQNRLPIPENELSRAASIEMDNVTNGPVVNQYMQTSAPRLFACGNVVHVNDLVDNVSTESMLAGKNAAKYEMGQLPSSKRVVVCRPGENVRYLCPQKIAVFNEAEDVTIYFRVKQPQKETTLKVSCEEGLLFEKRLPRVNPGEMQHIGVSTASLSGKTLTVDAEKRN
jgi:thioredoxin reductase